MIAAPTRIIAKRHKPETVRNGIILPAQALLKEHKVEIVSVGSEVKSFQVGQVVIIGKFSGTELEVDDERFIFLKEEDVLAVV